MSGKNHLLLDVISTIKNSCAILYFGQIHVTSVRLRSTSK